MPNIPKQPKPAPKPAAVKPQPATSTVSGGNGRIKQAIRTGSLSTQRASLSWFYTLIKGQVNNKGQAKSSKRRIADSAFTTKRGMPVIGQMYFYLYDAKYKDTLPYWDKFPLMIPIKYYKDGWLGLNLHYAPPKLRAMILDKLLEYAKAHKSEKAFMKVSYGLLKGTLGLKQVGPLIHRYLIKHVKTELVKVDSEYWEKAALLPVQQFQKVDARAVWKDGY